MTTLAIAWPHDGAERLVVEVDQVPADEALFEQRLRSVASMVSSHAGLRFMLEVRFEDQYDVIVGPTVGGVTGVELRKRS